MLLDKSILIHAPPSRVFAWLAPTRASRWDPGVVRGEARDGTLATGSTFDRVDRAQGHRFAMRAEATDVEPGRRFGWRQIEGDYAVHQGAFELEPVEGGTRLHLLADVEYPYRMPRLVTEDALRRELSDSADEALLRLKEMLESPGAS